MLRSLLIATLFLAAPALAEPAAFSARVTGHGKPVILVPGLTCRGSVWDETARHLAATNEVHVLTLEGMGGRPAIEGDFIPTLRAGLARYIREKKLDHPVIIGHSLGGFLAYDLAIHEPKLPGAIVSVDGLPFYPALFDPGATPSSMAAKAQAIEARMTTQTHEEFVQGTEQAVRSQVSATADQAFFQSQVDGFLRKVTR